MKFWIPEKSHLKATSDLYRLLALKLNKRPLIVCFLLNVEAINENNNNNEIKRLTFLSRIELAPIVSS